VPPIAVLGPGGVGGFLAAAMTRAGGEIVVVAHEDTAAALARDGLRVRSALLGDFAARPAAVAQLRQDVDALLVCTKATGLRTALQRIGAEPPLVVPLLNGVEHLAVLRERFGSERVAAGTIRLESDRPRDGEIVQTSPGCRVDLAGAQPGLFALAGALRRAGLAVGTGGREVDVMWSKLVRLCPLALTTSAADRPLGAIREDPRWRSALHGAVAEAATVARAQGADVAAERTLAELEAAHPQLGSSMRRDLAAGRDPELDAVAGAVRRAGARHGIRCPTIEWLAGRVAERVATAVA